MTTVALADHVYGSAQRRNRLKRLDAYKWTVEETRLFLELRRENIDKFHTGNRGSIQKAFGEIIDEMGLTGKVSPAQARKKWNNLAQLYRKIAKQQQDGDEGNMGTHHTRTWPFFRDVERNLFLETIYVDSSLMSDGANVEEMSEQINARFLETSFIPLDGEDSTNQGQPQQRTAKDKERPKKQEKEEEIKIRPEKDRESLLQTIKELSRLHKQQEEILHAKNKLTIALLTQLV